MCGIAGYIGRDTIEQSVVSRTLELMKNRGPDYSNAKIFSRENINVYFLHTRLSIIDLDQRSHQPFTIGGYTLVYNGEIYNYKEIREELHKKGHSFVTESDTEVLLRAYMEYGKECVTRFEGMWSFVIYDHRENILICSRDRFGEKPFYYLKTDDGFYFGSEIKFIKSLSQLSLSINHKHLMRYIINGYKSMYKTRDTFYEEIEELPYASMMVIDGQNNIRLTKFWEPTYTPVIMTEEEAIEGSRHYLCESMRIRLRSDVPMAFCLSGGVDSASLVSIAAKEFNYDVATFSIIDSDERYNEYDNIKATIDDIGCKHTLINLSYENTFEKLKELVQYHDGPIATITYLVHSFISEAIAKNGYKVAFSGTSADELFTGYYEHFNLHLYEVRDHLEFNKYLSDWEKYIGQFVRNPYYQNPRLYFDDPTIREHIYLNNDEFALFLKKDFQEAYFEEYFCDSLLRNRMLNELFHETTPVVLHEDDLNSMKFSIENRSPYLDSRLFQFTYSIPNEYLIKNGYGKYILREAVKGILNDQVRLDRRKKGFNASLNSIVDFSNPDVKDYLLNDSPVYELFYKSKIEKLFSQNPLPNSYSKFLFNFINAKMFLESHKESIYTDHVKGTVQ